MEGSTSLSNLFSDVEALSIFEWMGKLDSEFMFLIKVILGKFVFHILT